MNEIKYTIRIRDSWLNDRRWEEHTAKLEPWFDRNGTFQGFRVATGEDPYVKSDAIGNRYKVVEAMAMNRLLDEEPPAIGTRPLILGHRRWTDVDDGDLFAYELTIEASLNTRTRRATAPDFGLVGTPAPANPPPRYIARACFREDIDWGTVEPRFNREGQLVEFGPYIKWRYPKERESCERGRNVRKVFEGALKRLKGREPTPEEVGPNGSLILAMEGKEYIHYDADKQAPDVSGDWLRIEATF